MSNYKLLANYFAPGCNDMQLILTVILTDIDDFTDCMVCVDGWMFLNVVSTITVRNVLNCWCGPFKLLGLIAGKSGTVILAKVDIDENSDLAIECEKRTPKKYIKKRCPDRHKEDRLQLEGAWKESPGQKILEDCCQRPMSQEGWRVK